MPIPYKLITCLFLLQFGGCASLDTPKDVVSVPDKLNPAENESLKLVVPARGVQIYECRAGKNPSAAHAWVFVAPEADLFDTHGNRIGRHYEGPHWESTDGSKTFGTLKERAESPVSDAIPWLLLAAKSVGAEGSFSRITSIQRVNTVGGTAPKTGCTQTAAGATARIGYTADYYFFAIR